MSTAVEPEATTASESTPQRAARPKPASGNQAKNLRAAKALANGGQLAEAVAMLRTAWEDVPARTLLLGLALLHLLREQRDIEGVRTVVDVLRRQWPDDRRPVIFGARMEAAEGCNDRLVELLLPLEPSGGLNPETALLLARALHETNRDAESLAILEREDARGHGTPAAAELRGQLLLATDNIVQATAVLENACNRWPGDKNARLPGLLAHGLRRLDRHADAIALMGRSLENGNSGARACESFARACVSALSFEELELRLPTLRQMAADPDWYWLQVMTVAAASQRDADGERALAELKPPLSDRLLQEAAVTVSTLRRRNRHADAHLLTSWLLQAAPDSPQLLAQGALNHACLGETETAWQMVRQLLTADALDWRVEIDLLNTLLDGGGPRDLMEALHQHFMAQTAPPLQQAQRLAAYADWQLSAATASGSAEARNPAVAEAVVSKAGRPRAMNGSVAIAPDSIHEEGAVSHFRFSSETCFLWFAGLQPASSPRISEYLLQTFRKAGVSVVVVMDSRQLASAVGFGRHCPSPRSAQAALLGIIGELGYKRFATGGSSLAGFSAMLYGCEMGAAGSLIFSAPNSLYLPKTLLGSKGAVILRNLVRSGGLESADLLPLLEAHPQLMIHAHFGERAEFDRDQAWRIEHLPNVRLHPAPHDSHNSIDSLIERGVLEDAIGAFLRDAFADLTS